MRWERSFARLGLGLVVGVSIALVALFLVVDFGEWLRLYTGKPVADVLELYWYRSHLALVQFGPAAVALTGGLAVTIIRRRGEWTALKALGASPWAVVRPTALVALVAVTGLSAVQELVVARSGPRIDRMMVERFDRWGDFLTVYSPRRWFRSGNWFLNVRGPGTPSGLEDVRLFELGPDGSVHRWLEGRRFESGATGTWRLLDANELVLSGVNVEQHHRDVLEVPIELSARVTELSVGRPEWQSSPTLIDQLPVMHALHLPTLSTEFAIHQRWATAVAMLLAALITALLALGTRSRPAISLSIISGGVLYGALFLLGMVGRSLALNGHLAPMAAAWSVPVLEGLIAVVLFRRAWAVS